MLIRHQDNVAAFAGGHTYIALPRQIIEGPVAVFVGATTEATLNTFFAGLVFGVSGTKYRLIARQIEGTATLTTVAVRSTLRARFYPRTVLLAQNTIVVPTYDSTLEEQASSSDQSDRDSITSRESFNFEAHPVFQFDVTAFAGVIYKSARIRLTTYRTPVFKNDGPHLDRFSIRRILRADWDSSPSPPGGATAGISWDNYINPSTQWDFEGAQGAGDRTSINQVALNPSGDTGSPLFPPSDEEGLTFFLPDMTAMVNDAITLAGGILRILFQLDAFGQQSARLNRYYSSLPGSVNMLAPFNVIPDSEKPVLFFEAF